MRVAINTSQGVGGEPKTKINYFHALWRMGIETVQVFPDDSIATIQRKTHGVKGLILIGGPDIPPEFYGGRCHSTIKPQDSMKIDRDFRLIHFAISNNIPVLGICAGMQTLACFFGGSLFPHMPDGGPTIEHQTKTGRHRLMQVQDRLAGILHTGDPIVNTRHHQCVSHPGSLKVGALSTDGFIEAIYHKSMPIVGVQWHPEDLILESDPSAHLFSSLMRSFK